MAGPLETQKMACPLLEHSGECGIKSPGDECQKGGGKGTCVGGWGPKLLVNSTKIVLEKFQRYSIIKLSGSLEVTISIVFCFIWGGCSVQSDEAIRAS